MLTKAVGFNDIMSRAFIGRDNIAIHVIRTSLASGLSRALEILGSVLQFCHDQIGIDFLCR
eukprot:COSAG01_NODE_7476_length_3195_cov_4.496770_1_plen_60_part_10